MTGSSPTPTYNPTVTSASEIVLYRRPGCHLCEDARALLDALLAERAAHGRSAPAVTERDIETDPAWHRRYLETIPVIAVGDRELPLATSAAAIRRLLADALDAEVVT